MKSKVFLFLIVVSFLLTTTAYGAWGGGGCKPASSASRSNTTVTAIEKGKIFGGYVMSGFKSDYFIDETAGVIGAGNWYNQSISKKYKLNLLFDGFISYENWNNDLYTYGITAAPTYNAWLSFPITYIVYDYDKTNTQRVLEGYIQIRY